MAFCLEVVGWFVTISIGAHFLYNICWFLYSSFLGAAMGKTIQPKDCGRWAAVTGATDGIGKAYATKLAESGMNVLLISRTPSKLHQVAHEIRQVNKSIHVKTLAADFTEGKSIYPKLRSELNGLEIGVLVNNVGMILEFGENVSDIADEQKINDIINCNVMSMARLCYIVLPQMIRRKKGIIVNIGSIAGACTTPTLTLYGATKAFVDKFSRDLAAEVKSDGVIVQSVLPGLVATKLAKTSISTFLIPNPMTFVNASFRTFGMESRTSAFWFHKFQLYVGEWLGFLFPQALSDLAVKYDLLKMPSDNV